MLDILFQADLLCQLVHVSIDPHPNIPALLRLLQKLGMGSFPSSHDRRQKLDFCPLRQFHNLICHLIHRLLFDLLTAVWAVWNPDSRIQETEIIIDLCYRSYSRTWVPVRRFLINGNCRGKSLNTLYIRLFHLSQKLSCVGGQ